VRNSRFWIAAACGLAAITFAQRALCGGELTFQSRDGQRTHLVELYTSEGCSSCPPAEAWLGRLTHSPALWRDIVPVAFHVDYWDNLGWRDRFASPAATERQRAYAASWGSDSVYTPEVVLDGREWRQWSAFSPGELPAAPKTEAAGQLRVVVKDRKTATVAYRAAERPAAAREAVVALLGCDLNSNVTAGENRGHALRHDFVVLACETRMLSSGQPEATAVFALAQPAMNGAKRLALAVWVQEPGRDDVQQATGGWLIDNSGASAPSGH
jgi:hypothetical protein